MKLKQHQEKELFFVSRVIRITVMDLASGKIIVTEAVA
jgi:hypothetical protein